MKRALGRTTPPRNAMLTHHQPDTLRVGLDLLAQAVALARTHPGDLHRREQLIQSALSRLNAALDTSGPVVIHTRQGALWLGDTLLRHDAERDAPLADHLTRAHIDAVTLRPSLTRDALATLTHHLARRHARDTFFAPPEDDLTVALWHSPIAHIHTTPGSPAPLAFTPPDATSHPRAASPLAPALLKRLASSAAAHAPPLTLPALERSAQALWERLAPHSAPAPPNAPDAPPDVTLEAVGLRTLLLHGSVEATQTALESIAARSDTARTSALRARLFSDATLALTLTHVDPTRALRTHHALPEWWVHNAKTPSNVIWRVYRLPLHRASIVLLTRTLWHTVRDNPHFWTKLIRQASPNATVAVLDTLADLGTDDAAERSLLYALQNNHPSARQHALRLLRRRPSPRADEAAITALEDPHPLVRVEALRNIDTTANANVCVFLIARIRRASFWELEASEQRMWLGVLARIGQTRALPFLARQLQAQLDALAAATHDAIATTPLATHNNALRILAQLDHIADHRTLAALQRAHQHPAATPLRAAIDQAIERTQARITLNRQPAPPRALAHNLTGLVTPKHHLPHPAHATLSLANVTAPHRRTASVPIHDLLRAYLDPSPLHDTGRFIQALSPNADSIDEREDPSLDAP